MGHPKASDTMLGETEDSIQNTLMVLSLCSSLLLSLTYILLITQVLHEDELCSEGDIQ